MPSLLEDLPEIDTPKAAYVSLGLTSPLWLPFLGAASAGVAFWWMTRWMRPANLEAMLSVVDPVEAMEEAAETVVALTGAATEQVEAVVEDAVEASTETTELIEAKADEVVETTSAATAEAAETVTETAEATTAAVVDAVKAPVAAKKKAKAAPEAPLH